MSSRLLLFSLAFLLAACNPVAATTPTPMEVNGAGDAAVELIRQQMYHNLTQQAIDNERIEQGARATATQMVRDATATQQQQTVYSQATERAYSATQAAWQVTVQADQAKSTATAQAQAAGTQQAHLNRTATVEARQTDIADEKTRQAPIEAAKAEALRIEAEKARIELEQTKATMWASAWGGWVLAAVILGVAIFVVWKKSQVGVIQDGDGKVKVLMIGNNALLPDLMVRPVLTINKDGVNAPQLVSDETQRQMAHERNIVDAIAALPPGYNRQALGFAGNLSPQGGAVNIQVVQPGAIQPWLDDVQGQLSARVEDDA